ncbi:protein tyrosine/serine phosphatase [Desulfovibrio sp. X2]|uniref:dual specificity protein phosphatase family protein n=1 Tax=Desulfovibrio sp. X2 TaxID=941449 RepID=UPI00035898DC|nr:dual specificity protein phosphatase family protein [Desulfovibrio sp. X2]EPR43084.1 protein tyrosine/serine phosphatase [Desulfovibrio sp. X2]
MRWIHKKQAGRVALALCLLASLVLARLWYLDEQGNFHAVTAGEAYRSAQMDRDELEHYVRAFGIRTVVNLRGGQRGAAWYDEEVATCRALGVGHVDIALSATSAPAPAKLRRLLSIFRSAPRPILVHCKSGADRSGLAAALWKLVIDGESAKSAARQLSLRYGHMPLGPTQAMDRCLDRLAGEGGYRGRALTATTLTSSS